MHLSFFGKLILIIIYNNINVHKLYKEEGQLY